MLIRPVSEEGEAYNKDMEFLYKLYNHPDIRAISHNKTQFTYENHLKYWKSCLNRMTTGFWAGIIEIQDWDSLWVSTGCIRRDLNLISIAILPEYQKQGLGVEALRKFCKEGDKAEILEGNFISEHAFGKAGFKKEYSVWTKE